MNKSVSTLFHANGNKNFAVTLLGFAGAKDAHMQKYAQIYRDRGYDTIDFTALLPTVYTKELKKTREVSHVVEHLKEVLKEKDVAIHTLSMNGVFTLCSIQLQHPELNLFARTRGIFFDSGPVDLGFREVIPSMIFIDRYHQDILQSGDQEQIKAYKRQKLVQFFKLIVHYSILPWRRLRNQTVDDISAYDFLLNHPDLPRVMAFVYSKADAICSYKSIKHFATLAEKKGIDVKELYLLDSPHVDHYRKYPREYLKLIDDFLEKLQ